MLRGSDTMGDLILCKQNIAAMPYYVERVSLNIYSLEELCYYIQTNIDVVDSDLVGEDFIRWIKYELKMPELAKKLEEAQNNYASLSELITIILSASGFCSKAEVAQIMQSLSEMENKSEFECGKIRADRYLKNSNYVSSICEYNKLLQGKDFSQESNEVIGNIWHNLAVAYTEIFLYKLAAACFEKAYTYNNNPESMKEKYFALQCMHQNQDELIDVPDEWKELIIQDLQRAVNIVEEKRDVQYQEEQILEWKNSYRKYNKI